MTTIVQPYAPDRSRQQRMDALERANQIRTRRAQLKRDLKAGRIIVFDILMDPPEWTETMKAYDLIIAVPKYGRTKVNKIFQQCRVSPSKTLGGMTARQRADVIAMMRH